MFIQNLLNERDSYNQAADSELCQSFRAFEITVYQLFTIELKTSIHTGETPLKCKYNLFKNFLIYFEN